MLRRMKTWLESRRARFIILCLGTVLVLPSAGPRLVFDDHLQALMRMPVSPVAGIPHAPLDLFMFARPGPVNDVLIDRGMLLPWWTDRGLLIAFFRPLSSLTHVVDGWLWPDSPRLMHVQSVVWYALLLWVVSLVYRRFVRPPWLAGGAFLLYAIDDTHGATVSWIANRNAIIATLFGLLALLLHDRWRSRGRSSAAWAAWGAFAMGLLAGEAALGACAFVAAYALFLDSADRRSRLLSVLPYAAIVVIWRAAYQLLGYGAFGSDAYVDPGREPWAWLIRLPLQIAVLIQGQLGFFGADLWFWSPTEATPVLVGAAIGSCLVAALLVAPLWRDDAPTRFWTVSLIGALVPSASSIPGDRLLLFAGVAVMGILARLFALFAERLPPLPTTGTWRKVMAVPMAAIFFRRVAVAPILLPLRAHSMDAVGKLADAAAAAVPKTQDITDRTLVVVNPPANVLASYIGLTLATRGEPTPAHVRWLTTAASEITLTRISDRVLKVRPAQGFLSAWPDRLYRSSRRPLRSGERIELRDLTVTIVALTPNGYPAEADFEFREPLEAHRYFWMRWEGDQCVPYSPPRVGERDTLPAIDFLQILFDRVLRSPFRRDPQPWQSTS